MDQTVELTWSRHGADEEQMDPDSFAGFLFHQEHERRRDSHQLSLSVVRRATITQLKEHNRH
ncbi:hypothetical protein E4U30_003596 [Claviceps sp. LM220 group G6]|nr:hypothetical protein E4U15_000354 [Claviceps sp. LM218 group G6]KAG6098745.1 hypothetical protein E4U31_004647 [Claviceps sp. LM219 group G6]KAG6100907.1 hypothetical protein E4U30_003596 [Claviceps sp. LM220 group G6]